MKLMNRKISMGLAAGAMVAAGSLAMASPASAATLDVNFEGDNVTFTAVQANQTLSCPQFDLAGTFDDVTNSGSLTDLTASGCTNPIVGATTVTPTGTWGISTDASGTVRDADLTNVTAFVSAAGCSFNVAGAVDGTFDTGSQTFEVESSAVFISDNPSGFMCPILGLAKDQDVAIDGSWINTGDPVT